MERTRLGITRRPGRPRSATAHAAILDAAVALIRDIGYDAVTMDGIAARAGVGKATVYRRWAIKELLVAEAIERVFRTIIPDVDTGTVEGDLHRLMRVAVATYSDPASAALLSGLVAAMVRSEAIAGAVRSGFVRAWHDAVVRAIARGVARGELRDTVDADLAVDLLSGPLFHRYFMTGGLIDEPLTRRVVAAVLYGLASDR
jgi:AcrR family transcriptional regulator